MLNLGPWQVAGLVALIVLGVGAAFRFRKGSRGPVLNTRSTGAALNPEETARADQRADQLARLTTPSEANVGPGAAVELSNEKLVLRALDLSAQVRTLATAWAGQADDDLSKALNVKGGAERRAPDRLAEARHESARTLYQRIRHDVIDVRTELVSRLAGRAQAPRKPGMDRVYDYQGGTEPFQDIADDLELLANSLRGE